MNKEEWELVLKLMEGMLYILWFNVIAVTLSLIFGYVAWLTLGFDIVVLILLWLHRNKYKKLLKEKEKKTPEGM